MLVAPSFTYFVTPLGAWWSRRHEFQADDFAAKHSDARALAEALVKLYRVTGKDQYLTLAKFLLDERGPGPLPAGETVNPISLLFHDLHDEALLLICS